MVSSERFPNEASFVSLPSKLLISNIKSLSLLGKGAIERRHADIRFNAFGKIMRIINYDVIVIQNHLPYPFFENI